MAYEKDGIQYPSVTSITGILDKPTLLGWATRCACDYVRDNFEKMLDPTDNHAADDVLEQARKAHTVRRDSAADAGKICHKAIENHIAGEEYDLKDNKEATMGFSAFLQWEKDNDVVWVDSECKVFSVLQGYAGRFDGIAIVNGPKWLIDFKTSSGVYDEMHYQLCAYKQAYNEGLEDGSEPIKNMAILHLDKQTGAYAWHVVKDSGRKTELFNVLTRVYYLMKNRRLKNNPIVAAIKGDTMDTPF